MDGSSKTHESDAPVRESFTTPKPNRNTQTTAFVRSLVGGNFALEKIMSISNNWIEPLTLPQTLGTPMSDRPTSLQAADYHDWWDAQMAHEGEYLVPVHKSLLSPIYNGLGHVVGYKKKAEPEPDVELHWDPTPYQTLHENTSVDKRRGGIFIAANSHKFDPTTYSWGGETGDEGEVGFIPVPLPRHGSAPTPQPPPAPLPNACEYEEFPIPHIPRASVAKTQAGQQRFRERRASALSQRKFLHAAGNQLLGELSEEALKEAGIEFDPRTYCLQCGATFFERKGGKLRCRDCWYRPFERKWVDLEHHFSPRQDDEFWNLSFISTGDTNPQTDGSKLHDHQERKVWYPKWQTRFNPEGIPWEKATAADIIRVKSDEDFPRELARSMVMFSDKRTTDVAEGIPNTLTKQLSRSHDLPTWLEWRFKGTEKVGEGLHVVVRLNGVNYPKCVGEVNDPPMRKLRALLRHLKETEKQALKAMRKIANVNGWTERMIAAETRIIRDRVRTAYQPAAELLVWLAKEHHKRTQEWLEGCRRHFPSLS